MGGILHLKRLFKQEEEEVINPIKNIEVVHGMATITLEPKILVTYLSFTFYYDDDSAYEDNYLYYELDVGDGAQDFVMGGGDSMLDSCIMGDHDNCKIVINAEDGDVTKIVINCLTYKFMPVGSLEI